MARIRTIKPEFWSDSKTGTLSDKATKLFIGMLNFCDDYGVIQFDLYEFTAKIFPFENFRENSRKIAKALLDEILPKGLAVMFGVNNESNQYLWIKNFERHQKVDRPGKPLLPGWKSGDNPKSYAKNKNFEYSDYGIHDGAITEFRENSRGLASPRAGKERKGRERKGIISSASADSSPLSGDACVSDGKKEVENQENNKKPKPCQHQAVIDAYHTCCPSLPRVESWNEASQKVLTARWRERTERQAIEWWEGYFKRVNHSDFLNGRVKEFVANLNWLIGPKNMEKVLNGLYDNRKAGMPERLRSNLQAGMEFIHGAGVET
jgi:hypothetical protein